MVLTLGDEFSFRLGRCHIQSTAVCDYLLPLYRHSVSSVQFIVKKLALI